MPSPRLLVDPEEMQSCLLKIIEKQDFEIKIKELESGDYVVENRIGFKRMTVEDILKSIFGDAGLLGQIRNLAGIYECPILIIEGEDPFCSGQTINPGYCQNFLKTIAVSFRVPIIFTLNEAETAEVISSIVRAEMENLPQTE
jgi:ERCC4-type nuclease